MLQIMRGRTEFAAVLLISFLLKATVPFSTSDWIYFELISFSTFEALRKCF